MSDAWLFLKEFARKPGQLGAVTPSGPRLARAVVRAADLRDEHLIVELGAGTGPFTMAILAAVPSCSFVAFEPSDVLAARLRHMMPDLDVVERYADELPAVLAERGHTHCDRVISGLPWAVFDEQMQRDTLKAVTECMQPDGVFITFQYIHSQVLPAARKFRGLLDERFGRIDKVHGSWRNVPPAFLFVCREPR